MLHPAHQKKLWGDRPGDGTCGACEPGGPSEAWHELYNLGVAILLVLEYGDCGAGPELHDEDSGFCWGCGVNQAQATYARAEKAAKQLKAA